MTPIEILMPALSQSADAGILVKWLVKVGDPVREGDVIAEVAAGTSTMEVEAARDGVVSRILVDAGVDGLEPGRPIAELAVNGERHLVEAASRAAAIAMLDQPIADAPIASKAVVADDAMATEPVPAAVAVERSLREALREALAEEMRRDGDVFVLGEGVAQPSGGFTVCAGLIDEFGPRRVVDTAIVEQGFTGLAVGAAMAGLKPVVEFMNWSFAMQAIDQIVNSAAKTRYMSGGRIDVPVVFRGPNGASPRAAAQHAQCYAAWYAHVPGLKVVAPATPADAKGLLKAAVRDPGPVLVLEHEMLYGATGLVVSGDDALVEIGTANVVREGRDITLVSYARGVGLALEAAATLAAGGIEAEVVDLRSLRPLDIETVLASVRKTNRIVVIEDSWPVCSIGSEICARVATDAFDHLDAPPVKISGADVPMPYAANLEALALPNAARIVDAVKEICDG